MGATRIGHRGASLLAAFALLATFTAVAPAKADPSRIYCYVPGNGIYEYKGVTNEPTEDVFISADGSFSDAETWNGAYSGVDPTDGICIGKLPPGPNDTLFVGPVSNGTTLVSTTIGGGGGSFFAMQAAGAPPNTEVALTLQTNGSKFARDVTAQQGLITFQGGLSTATNINLTNVDQENPAQYSLQSGTYSAATAIFITGESLTVTAPSGATLQAPEVHIDDGGDLELGGKLAAANFLTVGEYDAGTLNIQSGAEVTGGNAFIGAFTNSSGNVTVNGKWTLTGELIDGQQGKGTLTVGAGGQLTTGDFMTVGAGANTLSSLTINGGGKVSVTPISKLPTDLALNTAVVPGSTALVAVDGAGSSLTINGALNVGYAGTATMEVTTGAAVNVTGSIVRVGRMAGSTGTLNLTGGSSTFSFQDGTIFQVGDSGTGNLNVTGGFQLNTGAAAVEVGENTGSQGTVLVSDPGTRWTVGGEMSIGLEGHGSLTVSNGGSLVITGPDLILGGVDPAIGDMTLSGAASSIVFPAMDEFEIGSGGHGNLVLNQGFKLDTGDANIILGSGSTAVGFASLADAGTRWTIGGDLTIGELGKGELDVTGGASLAFNGDSISVGESKNGGKLVLSGANSSLTMSQASIFAVGSSGNGEVDVNQGFQLDTGKTDVVIGASGGDGKVVLSDSGTNWTMGGSLAVGLDDDGALTISNGATLTLSPGATLGVGAETFSDGTLTLDGATSKLVSTGANLQIGVGGRGSLDIQNNATLDWSGQSVTLGVNADSTGTINVTSGGTFKVGQLTLGSQGTGVIDVGDTVGGTKGTLTVLGDTVLGAGPGNGQIDLDEGSKATFSGEVMVGTVGSASLSLDGASSAMITGDLTVADLDAKSGNVAVLGGSSLTVHGDFNLGWFDVKGLLDIDNGSTVTAQNGFSMTAASLKLANGSTFSSPGSSAISIGASADQPATIEVKSGSHLTAAGGVTVAPSSTVNITVDGSGSTFSADYLSALANVQSSLMITGGAQVSLVATVCGCEALTWQGGTISVQDGSVLSAPTASIGSAGTTTKLTLGGSGAAVFSTYLKLQPGSTLDVTGGGDVVVGQPVIDGGDDLMGGLQAGQIVVNPGGILKGVAGGATPIVNGDLEIQPGGSQLAGVVSGTLVVNGKVMNYGGHVLGDDPSTVTVNGSYTLEPTGVLVAEVGPTSYSKLIVNGPLILNGGTLEFEPVQGGVFQIGKTYDVISASGGVTGSFADVVVAQAAGMPFIELASDFVDGSLEVTALHMPGSFAAIATTPNQHAVASVLDQIGSTATGALGGLANALSNDDAPTVLASLDPLSGEAYGDFAEAGLRANRQFAALLRAAAAQTSGGNAGLTAFDAPRQPLVAAGAVGDPSVWLTAVGGFDQAARIDGAHTVRTSAGGLAGGVDVSPAPHWAVGVGVGYLHSDLGVGPEGSGALDTYQGALYGGYSGARAYVDAAAGYARGAGDLHRSLAPAAGAAARGRIQADQYFASGEAGVDLTEWHGVRLTPFAALDAVRYDQAALSETGAAGLGLAVDGRRTESVRSDLGAQLATGYVGEGWPLAVSLRLGWGHEFADPTRPVTAAFLGAPDLPFTVWGAPAARDFAVIGIGVGADLHNGVSLAARYGADVSGRTSDQRLSLDARLAW